MLITSLRHLQRCLFIFINLFLTISGISKSQFLNLVKGINIQDIVSVSKFIIYKSNDEIGNNIK